jgi:tRNA modification GTPase
MHGIIVNKTDTVAAISTGLSNSGVGIIRISGDDAIKAVDTIFKSSKQDKKLRDVKSHTINFGYIYEGETLIDEVLVSVMRAPNTYTREDVVEINCHGGIIVVKKVLDLVLSKGIRPAEPGEFTKRAFLNGRIDLSQAEAVMDVINSKSDYALKSSVAQLHGRVSKKIKDIRDVVLNKIAFIEASLDDPEHISLDNFSEEMLRDMEDISGKLCKLITSFDNGLVIKEGIKTVILGKPNAGKSSFLNAVTGVEKAIVTDIEGTTRDALEENIKIHGISLNIIDTAGIRKTEDIVEKMGVNKAKELAKVADLIIYLVDSSRELDENDREIIDIIKEKKSIILFNKSDLDSKISIEEMSKIEEESNSKILKISAKEHYGIEEFENIIKDMFFQGNVDFNDEVYISNSRQIFNIREAKSSIELVINAVSDGLPEDFYSIDLMNAYESLGKVIGEAVEDDLVDRIFSSFCMGK